MTQRHSENLSALVLPSSQWTRVKTRLGGYHFIASFAGLGDGENGHGSGRR